ncbi:MAG TPA: hypothetical protein VFA38_08890 [Nitrospirales bacterium]|nr:hypothetical protein [Nitrospirales bacterium]
MLALLCLMIALWPETAAAQVTGPEAEMDRLQAKAEDAIANGDAETAALNMGKAALMASQLSKRNMDAAAVQWYRGLEALFRAQEETYRAEALFVRAGGQTPASSGVCGSIALARQHIAKGVTLLMDAVPPDARRPPATAHAAAEEWVQTIDRMGREYQCVP